MISSGMSFVGVEVHFAVFIAWGLAEHWLEGGGQLLLHLLLYMFTYIYTFIIIILFFLFSFFFILVKSFISTQKFCFFLIVFPIPRAKDEMSEQCGVQPSDGLNYKISFLVTNCYTSCHFVLFFVFFFDWDEQSTCLS